MAKSKKNSGANDPFGYLKLGPAHNYLGHFKAPKYLEAGHNTDPRVKEARQALRAARQQVRQERREAFLAEHPVIAERRAIRQDLKAARSTGDREAIAAVRADVKDRIAAARANPESAMSERAARKKARIEQKISRLQRKLGS